MSARRLQFKAGRTRPRRGRIGLAVMVLLAALWLGATSRVHVNASWSDGAWGYAVLPLFGRDPKPGDRVLFDPPAAVGARVPYLKTVRGVPGMAVAVGPDETVYLNGELAGHAKRQALDGRPLQAIAPGTIPPGHYYLHAEHRDSHDSRYAEIGLVPRTRILGRAVALPDIPWLGLDGPLAGPEDAGASVILPHPAERPALRDRADSEAGGNGRSEAVR